jgi:hypothetical protein
VAAGAGAGGRVGAAVGCWTGITVTGRVGTPSGAAAVVGWVIFAVGRLQAARRVHPKKAQVRAIFFQFISFPIDGKVQKGLIQQRLAAGEKTRTA